MCRYRLQTQPLNIGCLTTFSLAMLGRSVQSLFERGFWRGFLRARRKKRSINILKNGLCHWIVSVRIISANKRGEIIGRIDYDPTLPGLVKKHFGFVLLLDDDNKLKDVRLNLWVTGP